MKNHFIEANPRVSELAGKFAVTRAAIVCCLESIDNGEELWNNPLDEKGKKQ